jgi:hypothetical protein
MCLPVLTLSVAAAASKPKHSSYIAYDLPSPVLSITTIQRTFVLKEGFAFVAGR